MTGVLRRRIVQVLVWSSLLVLVPRQGILSNSSSTQPETPAAEAWSGWSSLGKPAGGTVEWPVVGQNQDGRLEVYAQISGISSYYYIYQIFQWIPGSWIFSTWNSLGTSDAKAAPAVVQNQDGRLEVFTQRMTIGFGGLCPGPHYNVEHIYQTAINNGWSSWLTLDPLSNSSCIDVNGPYANRNQDGRLEIFVRGSDGNIWRNVQAAIYGGWGSWSNMGKPSGVGVDPIMATGRQQDGSQAVFVRGTNYEIYFNYQTAANNGWSGWVGMGKPSGTDISSPVVSQNQDGRLELFCIGSDGTLWHKWQVAPNSYWSPWQSLGQPLGISFPASYAGYESIPAVGIHEDGRMDVFVLDSNGALWHIAQTAPSNGWGYWWSLDKPVGAGLTNQLAVGRNKDGNLEIFAVGGDGALYHVLEITYKSFLPAIIK